MQKFFPVIFYFRLTVLTFAVLTGCQTAVEPGEFEIMVGSFPRDADLQKIILTA